MIWQHSEQDLDYFLHKLYSFNPSLQYTYNHSPHEVDFLDLSIYKSPLFPFTNSLDTKTYQKSNNLYQYLHFTSNHDKKVFKAIITGELIRYIRTNTLEENYVSMTRLLRARLLPCQTNRQNNSHSVVRSEITIPPYLNTTALKVQSTHL